MASKVINYDAVVVTFDDGSFGYKIVDQYTKRIVEISHAVPTKDRSKVEALMRTRMYMWNNSF